MGKITITLDVDKGHAVFNMGVIDENPIDLSVAIAELEVIKLGLMQQLGKYRIRKQ